MRIRIGEDARLQHLVRREADARDDVRRREGDLLDLGEVVFRVAVQLQDADVDRRILGMRPHLGEVERVVRGLVGVGLRHDLDLHLPLRELVPLDGTEQVFLRRFAGLADDVGRLGIGPVLMTLQGLEVELDPEALVLRVDERIGVRAVAVHLAHRGRQAAIREQDRHLVQALRRQRPEIPHRRRRAQVGLRMALLRVDEVRELQRIANEEHRRVVADQVPVAVFRIELEREAAHVALGVGRAELAGDGREAGDHRRLGAGLQRLRLGVFRDVAGDGQRAIRAPALGVHDALGNPLAILMGELLDQLPVLQQHGAALAGSQGILVVRDRRAGRRRQFVRHDALQLVWRQFEPPSGWP